MNSEQFLQNEKDNKEILGVIEICFVFKLYHGKTYYRRIIYLSFTRAPNYFDSKNKSLFLDSRNAPFFLSRKNTWVENQDTYKGKTILRFLLDGRKIFYQDSMIFFPIMKDELLFLEGIEIFPARKWRFWKDCLDLLKNKEKEDAVKEILSRIQIEKIAFSLGAKSK